MQWCAELGLVAWLAVGRPAELTRLDREEGALALLKLPVVDELTTALSKSEEVVPEAVEIDMSKLLSPAQWTALRALPPTYGIRALATDFRAAKGTQGLRGSQLAGLWYQAVAQLFQNMQPQSVEEGVLIEHTLSMLTRFSLNEDLRLEAKHKRTRERNEVMVVPEESSLLPVRAPADDDVDISALRGAAQRYLGNAKGEELPVLLRSLERLRRGQLLRNLNKKTMREVFTPQGNVQAPAFDPKFDAALGRLQTLLNNLG